MTLTFINLTPHSLVVHSGHSRLTIFPSGKIARVAAVRTDCDPIGGVETSAVSYGKVTGLPAPVEGVFYIVSGMVAAAAPRPDVLSPGELVRDENGRPVGCKGLTRSC
jgi:hypothetical protein